jgi:holliday junction DNA helicase RuvA
MIFHLNGKLTEVLPTGVVLDVQGVGYNVEMPLSVICELPAIGEALKLWTYTHVREESFRLFGFLSSRERSVFEVLIRINGVGPRIALGILSTLSTSAIVQAVKFEQSHVFEAVPGIGTRSAERILIELKPKLKNLDRVIGLDHMRNILGVESGSKKESSANVAEDSKSEYMQVLDDVRSALENLGFKDKAIQEVCGKLWAEELQETEFQAVMKRALLMMTTNLTQQPKSKKTKDKVPGLDGSQLIESELL